MSKQPATSFRCVFACLLFLPLAGLASDAHDSVRRFDLGPVGSPVEEGFKPLSAETGYSAGLGYGWESAGQTDFDVNRPPRNPAWLGPAGQLVPPDYLASKEHSAISRDGVSSVGDLVLRIDLPDCEYLVRLVLGRLDRPCCSMQVSFNGEPVAEDVHARHFARRGVPDFLHGFPRALRRNVRIDRGILRIRIRGDDSGFRERLFKEFERPAPVSYLAGSPTRNREPSTPDPDAWGKADPRTGRPGGGVWVYEDIGCPFTENALASVEVYPSTVAPLVWSGGRPGGAVGDRALQSGAEHFNLRRYEKAEAAFRSAESS